jgi:GR25 family glycosyltransferase involved in LPS biosynthesis
MIFAIILFIIITVLIQYNKRYEGMENHYLDGIDIIYWINLDRSPDRKKSMETMFQDKAFDGIPNQRISAIDGKKVDTVYDLIVIDNKKLSDNEYACLLSHLETIRTFSESKHDIALVMEDDVTLDFKPYWKKSVQQIMKNAPPDWDIIMLSYNNTDDLKSKKDYEVFERNYHSTIAYIINKKAATKLIRDTYVNKRYDLNYNDPPYADVYLYEVNKTYVYKYPMFIYKTNNDSVIFNSKESIHYMNESKQNILSIL